MNDLETYALIFAAITIVVMILFSWLFGQDGCCRNCEQGRRCKCQRESKRDHI